MSGPLSGIRILDLSRVLAGPYCTALLADLGAEILKLEPPAGDDYRHIGPFRDGESALFTLNNRGKKSLVLDLKAPGDLALAQEIAARVDVVVENFRPGVAARLGLGYENLSRDNAGLIYLSISGFGQSGPYSKRPGSDSVAQAYSGLVSVNTGNDGLPHRVGTTISDVVTGVYAFQAIATTLFARAATGTGRWIDVNLAQSTAALLGHKAAEHILEGGAHVDLVFTDMIMPNGMSGRDVARAAKELKPGIKVLLTSGYAEDLARAEELERESLKVLRKPYRQSDLVTVLREVLAGTACQHGAKGE